MERNAFTDLHIVPHDNKVKHHLEKEMPDLDVVTLTDADNIQNKSLDVIYLAKPDSDYRKQCDLIDSWIPKIRSGGMILGYGYTLANPSVLKAVSERFAGAAIFDDTIWSKRIA